MRPTLPMLLLSLAYAGCTHAPVTTAPEAEGPRIRSGGTVRLQLSAAGQWSATVSANVAAAPWSLAEPALPSPAGPSATPCVALTIDPAASFPGGDGPTPREIIAEWEDELRRPRSAVRWLLAPVAGSADVAAGRRDHADGLAPRDGAVELCLLRPTPDLAERLRHPALRLRRGPDDEGGVQGPGPFRLDPAGSLLPNADFAGPGPYLDRVDLRSDSSVDPATLLRIDELDLAPIHGRSVGALLDASANDVRVVRVADLDRVYFLWLDIGRRWVNDPTFRRWLAETIDREALVSYVFDGRGSAAESLSGMGPSRDVPAEPRRPFGSSSRPRLSLAHARDDDVAGAIAARLRASLKLSGVELDVDPVADAALPPGERAGTWSMRLMVHRPRAVGPVLALVDTFSRLAPDGGTALRLLDQASLAADPEARKSGAWLAEDAMRIEGRLIPLVRLHAWLALREPLQGVTTGPGEIRLGGAWWRR